MMEMDVAAGDVSSRKEVSEIRQATWTAVARLDDSNLPCVERERF